MECLTLLLHLQIRRVLNVTSGGVESVVFTNAFFSRAANSFGAGVFYLTDQMIAEGSQSGLSSEVEEAIYNELTAVGRGERDTLNVIFEFDSDENVEKNYGGDYFDRLR